MRICIRADGGEEIGMGHIMRMSRLAQLLSQRGHDISFACISSPEKEGKLYFKGLEYLERKGFEVWSLDSGREIQDLLKCRADVLITDSYSVGSEYFWLTGSHFPLTVYIDDEKIADVISADIIVNQNIYAHLFDYKAKGETVFLLGTEYVILREEFLERPQREIPKDIGRIMITVGGSDRNHLTEKILDELSDFDQIHLDVIVGTAFTNPKKLERYKKENVSLLEGVLMSEVMKRADASISSCGTTIYELMALGVPTIGIVAAENQRLAAEYLEKEGLILRGELKELRKCLQSLNRSRRMEMSCKGKDLVDGKGAGRIAEEIEKAARKKGIV